MDGKKREQHIGLLGKGIGDGEKQPELTMAEWQARRRNRPVLDLDFDAAAAIREERERRTRRVDVSRDDS